MLFVSGFRSKYINTLYFGGETSTSCKYFDFWLSLEIMSSSNYSIAHFMCANTFSVTYQHHSNAFIRLRRGGETKPWWYHSNWIVCHASQITRSCAMLFTKWNCHIEMTLLAFHFALWCYGIYCSRYSIKYASSYLLLWVRFYLSMFWASKCVFLIWFTQPAFGNPNENYYQYYHVKKTK